MPAPPPFDRRARSGSVLIALYAAIGMVALLGTVAVNMLNGPVKAMAQVTRRTIAENHMIASGKLALMVSARQNGDCDSDGVIEPIEWMDAGGRPAPANAGLLPPDIGAALQDPWGNAYAYCAWDHGTVQNAAGCGVSAKRLRGDDVPTSPVIVILSSGPDKVFQTGCNAKGQGEYLARAPSSDDLVLAYSFAEAIAMSGGLWNLKPKDAATATIGKNLSVTDQTGTEQLSFDTATKNLSLGSGGTGRLPNIRTDFIQNLTDNAPVEVLADLDASGSLIVRGNTLLEGVETGAATISTGTANAVAAIVTASGSAGIGLKASGTSKAIEADGTIDMTGHKILNLATPVQPSDAATKAYVDGITTAAGRTVCESFTSNLCVGGSAVTLASTSLGACKKACEEANVQCCLASFPALGNNPNAALAGCTGYTAPGQPVGTRNLSVLLGSLSAYCYKQY